MRRVYFLGILFLCAFNNRAMAMQLPSMPPTCSLNAAPNSIRDFISVCIGYWATMAYLNNSEKMGALVKAVVQKGARMIHLFTYRDFDF